MRSRRSALLVMAATASLLLGAGPALAEGKPPPGDPPGNNGTIKVVASDPSDPDPGNEPQLDSCVLWLEFYGFDQGQVADVTFSAQPPTGDKELLTWTGTISTDPAGGGQDDDLVIPFNLTSAFQGLEADPQKGYHVKVTSNSQGAPGGAKQKVFWLKCGQAPTGSIKITKASEAGGATPGPSTFDLVCNHAPLDRTFTLQPGESTTMEAPAGTACVVTETGGGAGESRLVESPADDAADGRFKVGPAATTTVEVLGVQLTQPDPATTLPRTGTRARDMALSAAGLAVFGIALRRISRRSESGT